MFGVFYLLLVQDSVEVMGSEVGERERGVWSGKVLKPDSNSGRP